jgi:hypothetical protein
MLLATSVFLTVQVPVALQIGVIFFRIACALYLPTMMIYVAELFPANSRAAPTAAAWMLNCVAAGIVSMGLPRVLYARHLEIVAVIVLGALVASISVIAGVRPHEMADAGGDSI